MKFKFKEIHSRIDQSQKHDSGHALNKQLFANFKSFLALLFPINKTKARNGQMQSIQEFSLSIEDSYFILTVRVSFFLLNFFSYGRVLDLILWRDHYKYIYIYVSYFFIFY